MRDEEIIQCENCGKEILRPVVIKGLPFYNTLCYSTWKWKKERDETQRLLSAVSGTVGTAFPVLFSIILLLSSSARARRVV